MINNTRGLKCYLCRNTINIGKSKTRIRKGQYIHSSCKRKSKLTTEAEEALNSWTYEERKKTLADKIIDWCFGGVG